MNVINYEQLKELKTDEIVAKMHAGEIVPPPKGEERDKFLQFAKEAPGSDFRTSLLAPKSDFSSAPAAPAEGAAPVEKKEEARPVETVPPASPTPAEGEKKSWWADLGYATEQEAQRAHQEQRELVREQKALLDRYNAERGTIGQKAKALEDRLKQLEEERKSIKPPTEKTSFSLKRPKPPKPSDFSDGLADDGYQKALDKYSDEMDAYEEEFVKHNAKLSEELESLKALKSNVSEMDQFMRQSTQQTQQNARQQAWSVVWDTATKLNDTYGLGMTISAKEISDAYLVLGDGNASVDQKAQAQRFVNTLSEKDRQGYEATKKVIETFYDFGTGSPVQKLKRVESAIIDAGLDDLLKPKTSSALTQAEEKALRDKKIADEKATVSAPSSSALASSDNPLTGFQTNDEKKARFKVLAEEYAAAANAGEYQAKAFETSPKFKEYRDLRLAMGMKIPPSFKRYQTT